MPAGDRLQANPRRRHFPGRNSAKQRRKTRQEGHERMGQETGREKVKGKETQYFNLYKIAVQNYSVQNILANMNFQLETLP